MKAFVAILALGCVAMAHPQMPGPWGPPPGGFPGGPPRGGFGPPGGPPRSPPGGFPMGPPPGVYGPPPGGPMGPPPGCSPEAAQCQATKNLQEINKRLVIEANERLFNKHDKTAIPQFFAENFVEHNPTAKDGTAGLREFADFYLPLIQKDQMKITLVLAEGDYVWFHAKFPTPGGNFAAIMDLVKVKNGKIVEHWDVIQDMVASTVNPHPYF